MTPYAEALERQIETLAFLRDAGGYTPVGYDAPRASALRAYLAPVLERAEPFWLGPSVLPLVLAGADALPDDADGLMSREVFPVPCGWVWLAAEVPVMVADRLEQNGHAPLRAFAWSTEAEYVLFEFFAFARTSRGPRLAPTELGLYPYPGGPSITPRLGGAPPPEPAPLAPTARFAFSFLLFVRQRLLRTRPAPIDRAARRRVDRLAPGHQPIVRVVELRRRVAEVRGDHGHEDIAWTCRWLVRGHWRRQWCPTIRAHKPIWITPYVKGPEDKPLKPARATVFAVVR